MCRAFVVRNHNGTLIAFNVNMVEAYKEGIFYEASTGNEFSVGEEEFEEKPERNKY